MRLTCLAETGFIVHKDIIVRRNFYDTSSKFGWIGCLANRHAAMIKYEYFCGDSPKIAH